MRFHVVALPHTRVHRDFNACAYTGKVLRFGQMMRSLGHHVILYAAEGSDPTCCDELVPVITAEEQQRWFGANDWHKETFVIGWDSELTYWRVMNHRAAAGIIARQQKGDFLCLIGGVCHKPIADAVGESEVITVEFGVGYYGVFAKHVCFESYTHQSAVYAMLSKDPDGRLYDCVIPNYFDPEDFPEGPGGDYLLYLGRLNQRKGLQIAIDTAKAANMRLIVAGQRGDYWPLPDWVEYAGYADVQKRAELMGGALAVLMPTLYMEPLGGVCIESHICGTPVVSTDWAAFSETIKHGVDGFRCHSLAQFVKAVKDCGSLDRHRIREIAISNYSCDRVKYMYETWFKLLGSLWRAGWPELGPGAVEDLEWLKKS